MKQVSKKASVNVGSVLLALVYLGLGVALLVVGLNVKGMPMHIPNNGFSIPEMQKWVNDNKNKDEFVCLNTKEISSAKSPGDFVNSVDKLTSTVGTLKVLAIVTGVLMILLSLLMVLGMLMKKGGKK